MKKILSVAILLVFLALSAFANPFVDVPDDAWYHDEVVKAVETGIINGKTPTEFKPDDLLTYAEAAKLAACMHQVYTSGEVTLKNGEPWYQPYVDYCMEHFIIDGEYDYNANATRAGYIEIFANALPDEAFADINNIPDGSILDVKDNAPYAIYVYKMYRAGIVTGVDAEHRCNPESNILRCEVATIISRMMDEDKRVIFDMVDPDDPGVTEDNGKVDYDNPPGVAVTPEYDNQKAETDSSLTIPDDKKDDTNIEVVPGGNVNVGSGELTPNPLTIYKQPEGLEAESYGIKIELEVQVYGGKAPYSYKWFYYTGNRNDTAEITNGDYIKDVTSDALNVSVEKENTYLGRGIYCVITDTAGESVQTNTVKVYGPFSMPADSVTIELATKKYTIEGQIADGIIRKGDKVSVERNGKIIAIGTAVELQMFGKSLDEGVKGERIGIVFVLDKGVFPKSGDTVIKYKDTHVVDTSDIVN